MSKSTLFVLAGFLIVAVVLGNDASGIKRSPMPALNPVAVTPYQVCRERRYHTACGPSSPTLFCSDLECLDDIGNGHRTGRAPDNMWCAPRRICRNGECVNNDRRIPEPALFYLTRC